MNLTHVLAFHRVATAGGFTAAANLSGVSQPTLSAQVRALEQTMGGPLFERSGRRIRLTPRGEHLLEATRRLGLALDEVEAIVSGARQETRGTLRVTADSAIHVLPVLARLKLQSSAFRFSLTIANSAEVIAAVLAEAADVGVTARPTSDDRLFSMKLRDDRLVVMVEAGDPLAGRRKIRLTDLAGRDLVVRERGSITREAAERVIDHAGIKIGNVFDVATREAVREAVAAGFGYGLVFSSETGADRRLAAVEIADADTTVSEFAICRAERRRLGLVSRFLDAAGRLAADSGWLAPQRVRR